jgi:hypothetical protein
LLIKVGQKADRRTNLFVPVKGGFLGEVAVFIQHPLKIPLQPSQNFHHSFFKRFSCFFEVAAEK